MAGFNLITEDPGRSIFKCFPDSIFANFGDGTGFLYLHL